MARRLTVTAFWDDEAGVWVATSDDIPGLATEAASLDRLLERVVAVTPELMEDNAHLLQTKFEPGDTFEVCIVSEITMPTVHAARWYEASMGN